MVEPAQGLFRQTGIGIGNSLHALSGLGVIRGTPEYFAVIEVGIVTAGRSQAVVVQRGLRLLQQRVGRRPRIRSAG